MYNKPRLLNRGTPNKTRVETPINLEEKLNKDFTKFNEGKDNKFDFKAFEQRNREIYKNETREKKSAEKASENLEKEKQKIDEATLSKLQALIKNDKETENETNYKSIMEDQNKHIYQDESTEKEILVTRPAKNFVWGLGNQTKQKKCIIRISYASQILQGTDSDPRSTCCIFRSE